MGKNQTPNTKQTPEEILQNKISNLFETNAEKVRNEKNKKGKFYTIKPLEKYVSYDIKKDGLELLNKYPLPEKFEKVYTHILTQKHYGKMEQETGKMVIEYIKTLQEMENLDK